MPVARLFGQSPGHGLGHDLATPQVHETQLAKDLPQDFQVSPNQAAVRGAELGEQRAMVSHMTFGANTPFAVLPAALAARRYRP